MKPLSTMNVIPFIDIMLVLLAVVLTTATFVAQGKIPITLPSAAQTEPLPDLQRVELAIDAQGQLYFAEEPMTLDQIADRLADVPREAQLLLRVDEATAFRHFVALVDLLKARGLQNLSIVARREAAG